MPSGFDADSVRVLTPDLVGPTIVRNEGINHLGTHGRWDFAEFTDVYAMQEDFAKVVEAGFSRMIDAALDPAAKSVAGMSA